MKLFNRLFRKKGTAPGDAASPHTLFEATSWLEQTLEQERGDPGFDAERTLQDISDALHTLQARTEELQQVQLRGTARENKIIEFNKNNMVRQVRVFIDNMKLPEGCSFDELRGFHSRAEHSLRICIENSMKSYQYTKTLLPRSREVMEQIKQINKLLEQLRTPLEHKQERISKLEDAHHLLLQLQQKTSELRREEEAQQELIRKILNLEEELTMLEHETEKLGETKEWEDYHSLKIQEQEIKSAEKKILEQLNRQITPLVKVLKRLEKQHKSQRHTLSDAHRETLTHLLNSPHRAKHTSSFLAYLKEVLQQNPLGINQQKIDKIITHIDRLLQSHTIEELQAEYTRTIQRLTEIKRDLAENSITRRTDDLNRLKNNKTTTLARLQGDLENCRMRVKQLQSEQKHIQEQAQNAVYIISAGRVRLTQTNQQTLTSKED